MDAEKKGSFVPKTIPDGSTLARGGASSGGSTVLLFTFSMAILLALFHFLSLPNFKSICAIAISS